MAHVLELRADARGPARQKGRAAGAVTVDGGDWPNTRRLLPWLVAFGLVLICLVPFDVTKLAIHSPVDLTLDRLYLAVTVPVWLVSLATRGPMSPRIPRLGAIGLVLCALMAVAVLSTVVNLPGLIARHELVLSVKKVSLLFTDAIFFIVVVSSVRAREVRAFVTLWLGLSAVTALGTVYQYRTGNNLFFSLTDSVLPSAFQMPAAPARVYWYQRIVVTGPTGQGLALTTMLALALPFAVHRILTAPDTRRKAAYVLLTALLLAGAVSTGKKSAVVVPLTAFAVLLAYRPHRMLQMVPIGLVVGGLIVTLAPGTLGTLRGEITGRSAISQQSTDDRASDYAAIKPDVLARPWLGRGYGSLDAKRYRLLDNQYLGTIVDSGIIGLLALLGLIVVGWARAHRGIRRDRGTRAPPLMACAAAFAAFGVAAALHDILSFQQGVYLLYFVLAITIVMTDDGRESILPHLVPARTTASKLSARLRNRRLLVAAAVLAGAIGFATVYHVDGPSAMHARQLQLGEAEAEMLVDLRPSIMTDQSLPVAAVRQRAWLSATASVTSQTTRAIAARVGIPLSDLAVQGLPHRWEQNSFARSREEDADRRAVSLGDEVKPYRLRIDLLWTTPFLRIYAQAPDQAKARLLVEAALHELPVVVPRQLGAAVPGVQIHKASTVRSRAVGVAGGAAIAIGLTVALVLFALFAAAIAIARRLCPIPRAQEAPQPDRSRIRALDSAAS